MKKRSPKEIIESTPNPKVEHAYVHASDVELTNITRDSHKHGVDEDEKKRDKILKSSRNKDKYGLVHTHTNRKNEPGNSPAIPSNPDIFYFLNNSRIRYSHIAQINEETGKVEGYISLAKTKKTKEEIKRNPPKLTYIPTSEQLMSSYGINIRYSPADGYRLDKKKERFVRKRGGLEKSVAIASIIGLLGSILFLSANFTGNVIGSLNQTSTNWIGGVLFLIGLVGAFAYFKIK